MSDNRQPKNPDFLAHLAGIGVSQGHFEELDRYASGKKRIAQVSEYILTDHPDLLKESGKLDSCGSRLYFHHWNEPGIDLYRLAGGFTCRMHLLCVCCAMRRSAKLVRAFDEAIRWVLNQNPHYVAVLITKTVLNGESLSERFTHITSAHRQLCQWRREAFVKSRRPVLRPTIYRHVKGAAGSYEFKRGGNSGLWHPHMHEIAILDSRDFDFSSVEEEYSRQQVNEQGHKLVDADGIPLWETCTKTIWKPLDFESQLAQEWWMITGDSYIVDVRRLDVQDTTDFLVAVCEAFKYALKVNELEFADQIEGYRTLKGRRLVYSYGCLHGVVVPDEAFDTVEDMLLDRPYVEIVYQYCFKKTKYFHTETHEGDEMLYIRNTQTGQVKLTAKGKRVMCSKHFTPDQVKDWVEQQQDNSTFNEEF